MKVRHYHHNSSGYTNMRFNRGFSYIELVFTVAILALLATSATPYLENTITRNKEKELRENLRNIRTAIDAYKSAYDAGKMTKIVGESGYPKTLAVLETGVIDKTSPEKKKIRFIRKIPADPMYEGEITTAANTWGKRSYDSEVDNPTEGSDVYDIYSLSQQKGLNDTPYSKW